MRLNVLAIFCAASSLLAGCVEPTSAPPAQTAVSAPTASDEARYTRVVSRMEPVIERECRARVASNVNCDFGIILDGDPRKGANAYQTLDRNGRPILAFTKQILADFANDD